MYSHKVFKPRPSTGWLWVGALGLVLLAIGLSMLIVNGLSGPYILATMLMLPLGLIFLILALCFPTMRYEMEGTHLTLTYGPLLRYTIDVLKVKSIRSCDLKTSPLASFRFPGLAIFGVPYLGIGTVKMCATAASTGILLIETEEAKYGLTPADEQGFVTELQQRMKR
jgi:hypothetical protein